MPAEVLVEPEYDDRHRLTRGLCERDSAVLEVLFARYKDRLFRYLVRLTGDRTTAEDLFQETWLRVVDRGHQFNPSWSFVAWLLGIARHLFIDRLRRSDPERLRVYVGSDASGEDPTLEYRDTRASPFDQLADRERHDHVADRFRCLPLRAQEVLTLRLDHGLSLREIARITGAPLPTVKTRLYRSIQFLTDTHSENRS
jgi:RNA polymerase sigma-70 factor (ECF subfamily)